jgi:hypothetical protein
VQQETQRAGKRKWRKQGRIHEAGEKKTAQQQRKWLRKSIHVGTITSAEG